MPYIGNPAVVGDSTTNFKTLDDITSYTLTFDATSTSIVNAVNDTLTFANHRFVNLQRVTYADNGGTAIGGLTDNTAYYVIKIDQSTIKLATNSSNAIAGTAINLTGVGVGNAHTLNIAFDGINTKFKATHGDGNKAKISRASQLLLSVNGVNQRPVDSTSPSEGFGIDTDSTIVFSTAPASTDKAFGSFIGEIAPSFDAVDNTVDHFTGNGSTTTFTLSKAPPSNEDILVSLDGVTQYPSSTATARAYTVAGTGLVFTTAPADGVSIQVRHIGYAGASTTAGVTALYGRTGNVTLKSTDDVDLRNMTATGSVTISGNATVGGNLDISGDITYDEVVGRNLNVTGVATVASGIVSTGDWKIGTATTLSQDNVFTTGIVTALGGVDAIGIMSGGVSQATGIITALNFIGTGNTVLYNSGTSTVDISISGGGGAVGTGTDKVFFENDQTVTQNYTISAGANAMSAGPIAIAANKTVTIPAGSEWTVV